MSVFTKVFDSELFKGEVSVPTGLFIGGQFVPSASGKMIETIDPSNGKVITSVSEGDKADVDLAVAAAQKTYETTWGENASGAARGKILMKFADLVDEHADELAALEALDNGKAYTLARYVDVPLLADTLRYYGGWADKNGGQVIDLDSSKLAYTRHEPIGVVAGIVPWNYPMVMMGWKIAPALATGNCIIMKPSEMTPLTANKLAELSIKAGLPAGALGVVHGYGLTVGSALSSHMKIGKIAFTGSTLVGRQIMKEAAASNLKSVTLELGGKSPNIIFDDANLEDAAAWAAFGIFFNHGQVCAAGSRVFVQESIYDKFMELFMAKVKSLNVGSPWDPATFQGPQVSQTQYDRIMAHIQTGRDQGATLLTGGDRHGKEGYFIEPAVFSDVTPDHTIFKEEIFGPVVAITKFKTDAEVIELANKTEYGLASAVFSRDISRAIGAANKIHAGTVWVNCYHQFDCRVPFGGYKQSGIGRELGEYALANYTAVKAVHINLTNAPPL